MTTAIAPIETRYAGHRFRSRLEARWAVFFDKSGMRYEYEKEGFNLSCGPYLPDFYLSRFKLWVEIKGDIPTAEEKNTCECFRNQTGNAILLMNGLPGEFWGTLYCWDLSDSSGGTSDWDCTFLRANYELYLGVMNTGSHDLFSNESFERKLPVWPMVTGGCYGDGSTEWEDAAKSARFESF